MNLLLRHNGHENYYSLKQQCKQQAFDRVDRGRTRKTVLVDFERELFGFVRTFTNYFFTKRRKGAKFHKLKRPLLSACNVSFLSPDSIKIDTLFSLPP